MNAYADLIARKMHEGADDGFDPTFIPDQAFDFQRAMIEYSVRKGRAAIFTQGFLRAEDGTLLAQATASCIPRSLA